MNDDVTEQMQRMNANLEHLIATFKALGERVAPVAEQIAAATGRIADTQAQRTRPWEVAVSDKRRA